MFAAPGLFGAFAAAGFIAFSYFLLTLDRGRANSPSKDDTQAGIKVVLFALIIAGVAMTATGLDELLAYALGGFKGGSAPIKHALPTILVGALTVVVAAKAFLPRTNNSTHRQVERYALGLLGFAYAMSWLMAQVGLMVRTPEVVNNASFIVIFPITFVANTFVPLETFPSMLRTFAEWNPVSSVVQGARNLFGNSFGAPDVWSLQHPVTYSALWGIVILAVFVPLSVRTFRNTASR